VKNKKNAPLWVVIKYDEHPVVLLCQRCGDKAPMPYGLLTTVLAMVKAFEGQHIRCKEKP
jgi:hypothetical protein